MSPETSNYIAPKLYRCPDVYSSYYCPSKFFQKVEIKIIERTVWRYVCSLWTKSYFRRIYVCVRRLVRMRLCLIIVSKKKLNKPLWLNMYLRFFASIHMEITEIKVWSNSLRTQTESTAKHRSNQNLNIPSPGKPRLFDYFLRLGCVEFDG